MVDVSSIKTIAVLISGSGSNLQALIDRQTDYGYRIALVVSNIADAYGLERAKQANIATAVINHRQFETRESFERAIIESLDQALPDFVLLAGFMRILTNEFISHYEGRLLNIHPSLLPKFKGLHTHDRAIEAGESEHGASVHFVTTELDGGPIIAQARVPVVPDDTPDILAKRVLSVEHQLYPAVVGALVSGKVVTTPTIMVNQQPAPVDLSLLQA